MKHHQVAALGLCFGSGVFFSPAVLHAESPEQILERYAQETRNADPSFDGFSQRCHVLYFQDKEHPHPKDAKIREILPLAPPANPKRIGSYEHVEEFLKPNCGMAYGRVWAEKEKGDVLSWIISIK